MVLFRDYGLHDHAMLRFSKGHKIEENFYVRQDGTRAFYFTPGIFNTLNLTLFYSEIRSNYKHIL